MTDVELFIPNQQTNQPENKVTTEKPLVCPVCKQANQCAVSVGKPIEDCWCLVQSTTAAVSKETLSNLEGKACVCQSCYQKLSV